MARIDIFEFTRSHERTLCFFFVKIEFCFVKKIDTRISNPGMLGYQG